MKKVLLVLLLIFTMLLSACGGVKYEYKDGVMYENKKPATGTFEFKSGDYKVKSQFVDGVPDLDPFLCDKLTITVNIDNNYMKISQE